MGRIAILLGLVLLAACARSEDASVVADTNELKAVEQVRTPEEDDEETAIGEWRETLQDENPALEFGPSGTPPLFSLRCDARRSVFLQRHGAAAPGDLPVMLVSIGSETRRLAVTSAGGAVPMLRASLTASDELIRILGSATTPITIRVGDSPPLVLPSSPALGTFLSRCASGADEAPEAQGEGNASADNAAAPAEAAPPPAQR